MSNLRRKIIWAYDFEKKKKKKKNRGFPLLKSFSWDTDLWLNLGDLTEKKENLEGKSVFNWKLD